MNLIGLLLIVVAITIQASIETTKGLLSPIDHAVRNLESIALQKLVEGQHVECESAKCVFEDVLVSFPLGEPLLTKGTWKSNNDKLLLNPQLMSKPCVVYGIGIADDPSFEEWMSKFCHVYAFDCTVSPDAVHVKNRNFNFSSVCIGSPNKGLEETVYGKSGQANIAGNKSFEFQRLNRVMDKLGHTYVDVIKLDIEGSEWPVMHSLLGSVIYPDGVLTKGVSSATNYRDRAHSSYSNDNSKRQLSKGAGSADSDFIVTETTRDSKVVTIKRNLRSLSSQPLFLPIQGDQSVRRNSEYSTNYTERNPYQHSSLGAGLTNKNHRLNNSNAPRRRGAAVDNKDNRAQGAIDQLPGTILMEVHTKWANRLAVPQCFVHDKDKRAVNRLFLALFKAGYRVVHKEINISDAACAEFTLIKVK